MKTTLKRIAAAMVVAGGLGGTALGNTGPVQIPLADTCLMRGVQVIDRVVIGIGGDVICLSYAGAPKKLQIDTYFYAFGFRFYGSTVFKGCVWAKNNDPQVHSTFC